MLFKIITPSREESFFSVPLKAINQMESQHWGIPEILGPEFPKAELVKKAIMNGLREANAYMQKLPPHPKTRLPDPNLGEKFAFVSPGSRKTDSHGSTLIAKGNKGSELWIASDYSKLASHVVNRFLKS